MWTLGSFLLQKFQVGNTRMDAAIDALKPMGFLPDVIRKKVRELLEVDAFFVLLLLSLYPVRCFVFPKIVLFSRSYCW